MGLVLMGLEELPFGPGAVLVVVGYVLALLFLGIWSSTRAVEDSFADHYLAGRDMGFGVLLLTLFATQYSGNSLFMNTGNGFLHGPRFLVMCPAMTTVCAVYIMFVPQLYQMSREHQFITPGDFLWHRYRSRLLCHVATSVMVAALLNYVLAQLKVMGWL